MGASPWRRSKSDLNAKVAVDASVATDAANASPFEALAATHGQLQFNIDKSLLAGVPLKGAGTIRSAPQDQATANAQIDAAGNTLKLNGQISTNDKGANDRWDLELDANALTRLEPLLALFQPAGSTASIGGSVQADMHASGRWPDLQTKGKLDAHSLKLAGVDIDQAAAQWQVGTGLNDPMQLNASIKQLQMPSTEKAAGPSMQSAELKVTGTARKHEMDLRAVSKVRPPAWVDALNNAPAQPPTAAARATSPHANSTLRLHAQGGFVDVGSEMLAGWRGALQQLQLRSGSPNSAPLLQASPVAFEAFWAGGPARFEAKPGSLEILSGKVRWQQLAWQAAAQDGAPARVDVDAQLDPLKVVPLLAALQPDFGWGGDLVIAGHIKTHSTPKTAADVVIERSMGDLFITTEATGKAALGLSAMRVALKVNDGLWNASLRVAGDSLGKASGEVNIKASPQALLPAANAALDGALDAQIADLEALASWMPPGWRLGGSVKVHAGLGGRFGAPQYTGSIDGKALSVRNFLEGIHVHDGDLLVRLKGETATIDHLTAKAGDGTLKVNGAATFGEKPQVRLQINAQQFQVLGRIDRRIVASGSSVLRMDAESLGLNGRFNVDEGLIDISQADAPALGEDVHVVRANSKPLPKASAAKAADTATTPPPIKVDLDLRVGLGNKLALRGHGLDAKLAGDLNITSPQSELNVNGTVRVVDGTYQAYGQNLVIDRGLVLFNGPIDRPRLDIEATRPKLDNVRVGVAITGSALDPRVRLFSEPDMSETDKLSWLIMGRASDNLGRTESALLQRAALALVSGEGPGTTDKVTKALGLDELSIGQTEEGSVKQTTLNVGKQLSDRWYLGYAQGLNAAAGSFQLIYKLAQRFTVRAQSGSDNSVDLIWSLRWQ